MAITWDATSTLGASAFTSAQTWAHTVGGGSNRYIWGMVTTEDFSTGGSGQEPSSFTYNGNALTKDTNGLSGAECTAGLYSGQDSIMGASGSHNFSISFSGHVDDMRCFGKSCDEMAQQVKEATGSVYTATTGTSHTSNITTLTDGAVIMAVCSCRNHLRTWTWNLSTEIAEQVQGAMVGGALYHEKATAGAQAVTATVDTTPITNLVLISAAYEISSGTPPTVQDIGDATEATIGNAKSISTDIVYTDGTTVTCAVSCTESLGDLDCTLSGSATVSVGSKPSHTFTVSGSKTDVAASIDTLTYTPVASGVDSAVTISADDGVNDPVAVTITVTNSYILITAADEANLNLAAATIVGVNAIAETASITVEVVDDNAGTGSSMASVVTSVPTTDYFDTCIRRRRRRSTY